MGSWFVTDASTNERAYWITHDLIRTWKYIYFETGISQTPPQTAGPATVEWKIDSTDGTYYAYGENIHLKGSDPLSNTVVAHEYGHNIMYTVYGNWMPDTHCPTPHYMQEVSHVNCAWTEGWANFLALAVNNDPVYRWASGSRINLENPTWDTSGWDDGDDVEGRVAGSLWDILDNANDGHDEYSSGGIANIWDVLYRQRDNNFNDYWYAWRSRGHNVLNSVMSVYQNTIDYRDANDDAYEQNDTLATAHSLAQRTWLSNLSGLGVQGDDDWFEINVLTGYERIQIELRFEDVLGDIDLGLFDSSGTMVASATTTTDNEFIDYSAPAGGGYYYIKVYNSNQLNRYDLWWDDILTLPYTPSYVSATDGTDTNMIQITWRASLGATSYEIWRNVANSPGSASRIASSVSGTSYDDTSAHAAEDLFLLGESEQFLWHQRT